MKVYLEEKKESAHPQRWARSLWKLLAPLLPLALYCFRSQSIPPVVPHLLLQYSILQTLAVRPSSRSLWIPQRPGTSRAPKSSQSQLLTPSLPGLASSLLLHRTVTMPYRLIITWRLSVRSHNSRVMNVSFRSRCLSPHDHMSSLASELQLFANAILTTTDSHKKFRPGVLPR